MAAPFAENLRRIRLDRGLSQRELNELSGLKGVAMYESGQRTRISYDDLRKLANALKVPVDELKPEPVKPKRRGAA